MDGIRPYLPLISHLPYGKKIQYKIMREEGTWTGNEPRGSH